MQNLSLNFQYSSHVQDRKVSLEVQDVEPQPPLPQHCDIRRYFSPSAQPAPVKQVAPGLHEVRVHDVPRSVHEVDNRPDSRRIREQYNQDRGGQRRDE